MKQKQVKTPLNEITKKLVLNLPTSLFEEVREKAHKERTSRSYLINQAIINEIKKGNK